MEAIAENSYDIRKIFDDMALDLIQSQRRTFLRHQGEQLKEGFQWEQWQLSKLKQLRKYRQENKAIIDSYSEEIDSLIDEALLGNFRKGEDNVEKAIDQIKQLEIETPDGGINPELLKRYTPDEIAALGDAKSIIETATKLPKATGSDTFFGMNNKKLEALQKSVKGDMRNAQHAVLRKMDDVYRQTIFKSQVYMGAGATTLNQAVDMATKDFLAKGINCIQYKDGKMVNVASWAEMSLRTASHRATMLGEGKKQDEWGMHLVVITAHGTTCEMCLPWQGKVLIDDVFSSGKSDGKHTLLSVAIDAGLFHPNCRHSKAIYFEGITQIPTQPVDDETAVARYDAEQKQRTIENNIRKYKRLEAGSLEVENQAKYGKKVQEGQGALREHVKGNTHLRKNASRTAVDGGLTVKQRNNNLKEAATNVKIKEIRNFIKSDAQIKNIEPGQQRKHIQGTHEYKQYQQKFNNKGEYGPARVNISPEEIQQLVNKYAGTGNIKLSRKGEWDRKEIILGNEKAVGIVVNNITGAEAETTVFKIHYSNNGTHLVPDYPSKKKGGE